MFYLSSEEAPMRLISPDLDLTWIPKGGEPIIGKLDTKEVIYKNEPVLTGVVKNVINSVA
jgi:hypothetical protein